MFLYGIPVIAHAVFIDFDGGEEEEHHIFKVVYIAVGDTPNDQVLGYWEDAFFYHGQAELDKKTKEVRMAGVCYLM